MSSSVWATRPSSRWTWSKKRQQGTLFGMNAHSTHNQAVQRAVRCIAGATPWSHTCAHASSAAAAVAMLLQASDLLLPPASAAIEPVRQTTEAVSRLPPVPNTFPPLPDVKPPQYTLNVLPNGLRVFLLEDHEVPLVRGTLLVQGGQLAAPPDKGGLASILAGVQRAGGSTAHPGPELDALLEELAAAVELGAGASALNADFFCVREDVETVMGLFAEVVRSPLLPEDKLALYKEQVYRLIEHQYDEPSVVVRRQLQALMYGRDSLYARQPTRSQVESITLQDMRGFMQRWERPDAAVLGVVGDFDSQAMMELVRNYFGTWQPADGQPTTPPGRVREDVPAWWGPSSSSNSSSSSSSGGSGKGEREQELLPAIGMPSPNPPAAAAASWASDLLLPHGSRQVAGAGPAASGSRGAAPSLAPESAPAVQNANGRPVRGLETADVAGPRADVPSPLGKIYLIDRPGLMQASVVVGEPGISLQEGDVYALDVLAGIYNGFGGELFNAIRSQKGLAYSVAARWDAPLDHRGLFVAAGQTSEPGELLVQLRDTFSRTTSSAPSPEALSSAKDESLNAFVFNFASKVVQLQRLLVYDLLGLPEDYIFQYRRGIEAVQEADVLGAAQRWLHPGQQVAVVMGDAATMKRSLEAAGFTEITPLELPPLD